MTKMSGYYNLTALLLSVFVLVLPGSLTHAQKLLVKEEGVQLIAPQVSPDGAYITLTSKGYDGLWVVRSDGYALHNLSDTRGSGYLVEWSPDSKWILFREEVQGGRGRRQVLRLAEVYTRNISGVNVPVTKINSAHWFGEDKILLRSDGESKIFKSPIVLGRGYKSMPALHTEPKQIVIEYPDGKKPRFVKPVLGADYIDPRLSPDGTRLLFRVAGGGLYVYELQTFRLYELGKGEMAVWSPDGKKVAYVITSDKNHITVSSDLYVIDYDGSGKLRLTDSPLIEMRPCFFHNGRRIVYDTDELGEIRYIEIPR